MNDDVAGQPALPTCGGPSWRETVARWIRQLLRELSPATWRNRFFEKLGDRSLFPRYCSLLLPFSPAQRHPGRGPLDGTLTLFRFGGKYTEALFAVISCYLLADD